MDSPSAAEVASGAAAALGSAVLRPERLEGGYSNDNWRVTTANGARYAVKFGPLSSESKWRSTRRAHAVAAEVGVPVAPIVHHGVHVGRLMRIYRWIDGTALNPRDVVGRRAARAFSELGAAVAALHSVDQGAFSSRLDGSSPSFAHWSDYISYRLGQVDERCRATHAVDQHVLDAAADVIQALARTVSAAARPTLCHRDLYADNILVDGDGRLVAILDFDLAEVWDSAGEWFKLDRWLFPSFPESRAAFTDAYRAGRPPPPQWDDRTRLVDLIETLNVIPNAMTNHWRDLENEARQRLAALLG